MVDKKTDEKEANELKRIYNRYHDKRSGIMKNNQFKVQEIFDDTLNKTSISPEPTNELNNF